MFQGSISDRRHESYWGKTRSKRKKKELIDLNFFQLLHAVKLKLDWPGQIEIQSIGKNNKIEKKICLRAFWKLEFIFRC